MSAGSELLGYTGAALRLLQSKGDVDSTWYGDEVLGSVNSIPSRMNPPISTHTKNRIALPLSIGVHSTGIACKDQATSSAESSPRAGGGVCDSSTPLANTSPVRGSSTVPSLDDSMALPVPATVKVSAKKVREIHSPYSAAKGAPLECRRGNNKHAQGSHLRVFHKSLRQGVLHTAEEGSSHHLDTSDDSIVVSITESGDNCKLGKLKLLEKQSTEQEAHQVFITPVIVSCPQNISPADLDRPAKGSWAMQGKAGAAAVGEPAQPESLAGNMCAARHGQGPLPLTDRGTYRDVADVVLPTSAMGPGTCCHDSDRAHTVGATSCTRSHAGTSMRDLEDHIHDRSLDVLKRLQSLEHLHRACTVNSAKLLTKACDDVIQMAQKKDMRATCSTRDQERDKPIRMADDSTQTVQEQLLVTAAPKKEHSMECMPADKDKHPIIYSHVERTLPPVEQLEVLVEATKVLDEVKRAHEALETESVLLERRHRTGLGKLLNQCQSGASDLKEKKKVEATNDVPVRRQGKKEAVKGSLKPLAKHKSYQSSKHPGEVKHVPQQSTPSSTQIGAGAMRRIGAPASAVGRDMHHVRPVGAGQQARVAIPPPPPPLQARVAIPPPPPPPLNAPHHPVSTVTSSAVNAHPLQTSAIPMFTPQVVPSHGTARQQHSSEASTQTQLFAGKPGSAAVVGCCEMGTQAGGGGAAMEPTSKSLVVTHLPLVNISTSLEGSMTTLEQDELQSSKIKDEDAVEQEVFLRSCSTAASAKPMGDSGHEENAAVSQQLEEVVICGQNGPPVQLDSAPLFQPQTYGPLGGRCQGTTMSSEELEQRLNKHVTSQALQWVQQELFARAMAQVSLPSDPTTVLHQDPSSNSCSTCPPSSNHSMAQSYGGGVLQWFADSGIPVDSELVHKLVQEIVVEEGVALGGDEANKDRVSEERSSESEEEFSYTPPASSDASTVTMVPTPKPTPSPSPPASPPPCESANPLFVETVLTPNPTPPPASPTCKSQRPIQLQDEMLATPQSTEAEDLVAQTSVATSHSQTSWHVQEVEGICTPSTTPPPPPQLLLSPMSTPASTVEITQPPPTQPTIEESPATKEPSLSESATSSSSCVVHSSAVHNTTTSTTTDREISMGELIKQSVSHEPGVSFSEGEVPLSPGDARWKAFHTKIGSLFPATKQLPIAHQTPILDSKTVGGASREDFSEMSSDSTQYGIEMLSEGQATRGHFGGFLSKLSTSTPENSTQTPNHTDDDDDSTHPATDTTFAEDNCTSLPAPHGPGQLGAPHGPGQLGAPHGPGQLGAPHGPGQLGAPHGPGQLGASHGPGQLGAPHGPGQLGAPHGPGQLGASHGPGQLGAPHGPGQLGASHGPGQLGAPHGPGQLGAPHGPGQLGAASPGEVRKPAFVNYSMSQSECDLDSMASASEGEVRLETRNGIDVIRVSRRSSGTLAESKALKRKYEAATSGQHITVSETAPLQHQGYARGDTHGDAAGDICSSKAYPVILVAEGKKRQ